MKKGLGLLVCLMMLLCVGCTDTSDVNIHTTAEYTLQSGIILTAEAGLTEMPVIGHDISLQNENIVVAFDAVPKAIYPEFISLEYYANAIKSVNAFENDLTLDSFDNLSYRYEGIELEDEVFCYLIVEETETCYWLLQMWCPVELRSVYEPVFPQWLDSIVLPETVVAPSFLTKTYDMDCGLSITMPDDMIATEVYDIDSYYYNDTFHIFVQLKDKPSGQSLEEYAEWYANYMNYGEIEVNPSGHPYTTVTADLNPLMYYYLTIHETPDSYVILSQACPDIYKDAYMELILECADSLRVTAN